MSALAGVTPYGATVLAHLDAQLASARRLLDLVLEQGRAIREREVEEVLVGVAAIQAEMERRGELERERTTVLLRAGSALGLPGHAVDLEALASLLDPAEADQARAASAELRGLLDEIVREHRANRLLMRQELAFVDHLVRTLTGSDDPGYGPGGVRAGHHADRRVAPRAPTFAGGLDLRA